MDIQISKAKTKEEIDAVFDGDAPHYHPDEFWKTRMDENRIFIAKHDGKSVGLLTYTLWWGNTAFLELIHIQDKFQRKGIGKSLLKNAASEIKFKKLKILTSSCEQTNNDSHSFHKALGFEKLNSLRLPHGEEQFYSIALEKLS